MNLFVFRLAVPWHEVIRFFRVQPFPFSISLFCVELLVRPNGHHGLALALAIMHPHCFQEVANCLNAGGVAGDVMENCNANHRVGGFVSYWETLAFA
jgi:hypothetical protein